MITQRDVNKAREDCLDEKISYDEYRKILDRFEEQKPNAHDSSDSWPYREPSWSRPKEFGVTAEIPRSVQETVAAINSSRKISTRYSPNVREPRSTVIYVSPTNYDGSILSREQPNHQDGHVRSVWELQLEKEYCLMKSDEKGTRQIGNVIIKGRPKEKPFRAEFYPVEGGVYEKNIDPVQYGLLPNGRGLWNASFWLATR